jgi:hypothetical protein
VSSINQIPKNTLTKNKNQNQIKKISVNLIQKLVIQIPRKETFSSFGMLIESTKNLRDQTILMKLDLFNPIKIN